MSSLLILSASITNTLKQNDKFFVTFIVSLILIFFVYFMSNLFDALGSSSQISPLFAKICMPFIVVFMSILIFKYPKLVGR